MIPDVIFDGAKANGNSVQGRYNGDTLGYENMVGPISPFSMFTINMTGLQADGIPQWSYYPQERDRYLRLLSKREPIMAGALYSVVSRIKSLPWNIKGGVVNKNYYQGLLAQADGGAGFGQFVSKVVSDLLNQDNGAFIELVGAGRWDKPLKGRVKKIYHLDSARCLRTFDTEFPVIYIDPLNNSYHRLHKTRVVMLSSNPQPDELARNVGFCAVSRALKMMQIIRNVETYKDEKVSGKFKRAIGYGNGFTPKQFKQVMDVNEQQAENSNFTIYNEIPFLISTTQEAKLGLLDLASLPDGFQYKEEIDIYVYILALCFGTDAREFWPATASGATKADASVQHLKAQGKGIADIIKMIETAINWQIMPANGSAEFEYDFTDDEQDKAVAEGQTVKATNIAMYQQNGWITPQEGRALAIAQGLFDPKQLVISADNQLADDSAPMEDNAVETPDQPPIPEPAAQVGTAAKAIPVEKHVDSYQKKLESLMTVFVDKVVASPGSFDSAVDSLTTDFMNTLPNELTSAFGVGLSGAQPTPDGIDRLKKVGQTSVDYFKDSFLPALSAVSLAGLAADEIKAALNPFVSRLGLYAGAYWESIWQGQRDATPIHLKVKRVLQDGADHCPTCPGKAGVYDSYDDMIAQCGGVPADGSDSCLSNCRCKIFVETESGGFEPLVGSPTVFVQPLFEVLR